MTATHAQPSAPRGAGDPRGADLCRRRPDHFAAVVRYADALRSTGVDHHAAWVRALDEYDRQMQGAAPA